MQPPEPVPASLRRRTVATLFGGVALGSLGFIPAFAVVTLLARELTGSAALSGLPVALAILGTAAGAWLLSGVMARRGRRPGLVLGFIVGGIGASAWFVAALTGQLQNGFPFLQISRMEIAYGLGL
jgi:MFS family permease